MKADGSDGHRDWEHVGSVLGDVLKEVSRRCELRARLEAEWGRELIDSEFLAIAESGGTKI